MVRYRQETGERGYTFRLNGANSQNLLSNGISHSDTFSDHLSIGSERHSVLENSIVYKERIDSLFRERAFNGQNGTKIEQRGSETVKADEPTMEHLKMHFQKVLAEHRGTPISTVGSKNKSTTYIQIHNQVNKIENKKGDFGSTGTSIDVALENRQRSFSAAAVRSQSFNEARNAVQAQIEKMFQDAAKVCTTSNQEETDASNTTKAVIAVRPPLHATSSTLPSLPSGLHNKQSIPLPPIPTAPRDNILPQANHSPIQTTHNTASEVSGSDRTPPINNNKYKVDYLGSLALQGRATSLESLQLPLKELYYRYRHALSNKLNIYRGTMDISAAGLRIQYYSDWRTVIPVEIVNPFPTIAVWAAVKFVHRVESNSSINAANEEKISKKFAFLPLICDPENQEKQSLFHPLGEKDVGLLTTTTHPPMFTCVMRKMGAPKTLECHAFVCNNPEDAIVIAANLYQALLRNMKTTDKPSNGTQSISSNNCNGTHHNAVDSTQGSADPEPLYSPDMSVSNWSDSSATSCSGFTPVRPPRRKKRLAGVDSSGLSTTGLEKRKSIRRSNSKARALQGKPNLRRSMRSSSQRSQRVKRSVSDRQLGNILVQTQVSDGDILTKVAIPRSKSFMTVPQNYSIGELFEELKKQEGVQNVDDVLKVIVNKDRMSFNDLQPAYKELLMKLALTLSKDEMFQRSKNIMRNQTNKSNKSARYSIGSPKYRDSDAEQSSSSRISSVLRATKKSLSKWSVRTGSGYSVTPKESVTLKNLGISKATPKFDQALASPEVLTASKGFASKTPLPTRSSTSNKANSNQSSCLTGHGHGKSATKETSSAPAGLKGYISCSECAYDSESCSQRCYCSVDDIRKRQEADTPLDLDTDDCSDGEKCYCSLSRVKTGLNDNTPIYRINLDSDSDASHVSSNSSSHISCSSIEQVKKQYNKPSKNRHNYARKSGSLTSWTALSGAESPLTAWRKNTANINQQNRTALNETSRFNQANAGSLRRKSLSSYLSDTSLDSDIVAMTEPAKKSSSLVVGGTPLGSGKNSFAKNPALLRQKSRSSYLSSETELESLTTSCNSFIRAPVTKHNQASGSRKASPSESVGYQSYDSTEGSNGKGPHQFLSISNEKISAPYGRRNSNSSSDRSQNGNRSNKKVLMVSAVDPKGKVVYRGTSSAGTAQYRSPATGSSEGVLSVKKTAEIAAMFSNLKLNQTTDIIIDSATEDTESDISIDDAYSSMRFRGNRNQNGFSNGLEDSLGYLP